MLPLLPGVDELAKPVGGVMSSIVTDDDAEDGVVSPATLTNVTFH